MSPVIGGSKAFWTDFIKTYESLPALWNVKSDCYKNRNLKDESYQKLVVKLQEIEPSANREIVRRKINSLRCSYRRELNKIKESQKTVTDVDELYCTSLWYFKLLGFLREHENYSEKRCAMDNKNALTPLSTSASVCVLPPAPITVPTSRPSKTNSPPVKKLKNSHQLPYTNVYLNQFASFQNSSANPNLLVCSHQDQDGHDCSSCPYVAAQESEYDKMGKAWAAELLKMSPDQQIFAKRAIAEIIFEGQLGALHRNSVLINHIGQQMEDEIPMRLIEKEEPDFDY